MFWFWVPITLVALVILLAVIGAVARRKRGAGHRQEGETVYDQAQEQRKAPQAPPA